MKSLLRIAFSLLAVLLTAGLFAQTVTNAPNQNNGAVTKVEPGIWETPFLWIAIVVFGAAIVLLIVRKSSGEKTETIARPHHTHSTGANNAGRSQRS